MSCKIKNYRFENGKVNGFYLEKFQITHPIKFLDLQGSFLLKKEYIYR